MKLFKLTPELHWTAGGYVWPVDGSVECGDDTESPRSRGGTAGPVPGLRGAFSIHPNTAGQQADNLKIRVEDSGAIPLAEADITIMKDWNGVSPPGKERVPFASGGELGKLVVNVLMVVFIP